jgi:hypothetical protein
LPYWPCEISRCLAVSKRAKIFAWAAVVPVLFYHWFWHLAFGPADVMALGVLGVLLFDDFSHWLLHIGSVAILAGAAAWQIAWSGSRLPLGFAITAGLVGFVPMVYRAWCVAVYEHPDEVLSTTQKLMDFKQQARQTRRIHLKGQTLSHRTLQAFHAVSVAEWVALALLAAVFDL